MLGHRWVHVRFGINALSLRLSLEPRAGCVLLITFLEICGQHYRKTPYSVLHTDRPSSAENIFLSAEEETPKGHSARLHLMSGDIGDNPAIIALPPGPRARGRGLKKSCGAWWSFFVCPRGAVLSHKRFLQGKANALCGFAVMICATCVRCGVVEVAAILEVVLGQFQFGFRPAAGPKLRSVAQQ